MSPSDHSSIPLTHAFRFLPNVQAAIVGAGGKTTALIQLAHELRHPFRPLFVTTTTHLAKSQVNFASRHIILDPAQPLPIELLQQDDIVLTGVWDDVTLRWQGITNRQLQALASYARRKECPLLIEADGARQLPLKAPAENEPVIPSFVSAVIVVAGLNALNQPLTPEWVHRAHLFSQLSGLKPGERISLQALASVLTHPQGGCKGIPPDARKICLLTHADTLPVQAQITRLSQLLASAFDSCVFVKKETAPPPDLKTERIQKKSTDTLNPYTVLSVHEPVAGVVLAAGGSKRLGKPKQLLLWQGEPLVHRAARLALEADLHPVMVVCGAESEQVKQAVSDLPVQTVENPDWQSGQSTSIRAALQNLPSNVGSAVFLLVDQPYVSLPLLRGLVDRHTRTLSSIVAPLVDGQRGNPVLFDRETFPDLLALQGDVGGRALFSRFSPDWLPWHDSRLLTDIDTPHDLSRFLENNGD